MEQRNVLIVANRTIGGNALSAALSDLIRSKSCHLRLLVPVPSIPPSSIAVDMASFETATPLRQVPDQRRVAEERLACGLRWLHELGASATGEVVTGETVTAVADVVDRRDVDEIIVSTLPNRLSRWLRQDLPHRIHRRVDVPVTVVTAGEQEPRGWRTR